MDKQIDDRTHCSVFNDSPRRFSEQISISFDFSPALVSCSGNILRITDAEDDSFIWNMSFEGKNSEVEIRINEEGRSSLIYGVTPRSEMTEMTWTSISLCMDFLRDSVHFEIGPRKWAAYYDFKRTSRKLAVDFGKSGHMTDVAPFAIRDLKISDSRRSYEFPLDEVSGKYIHDLHHKVKGRVENPVWMITESLRWTLLAERKSKFNGGSVYDPYTKRIYLYDSEGLWSYDAITKNSYFSKYTNPCPLALEQGICYISGNSLVAYETRVEGVAEDAPHAARLDLETNTWTQAWRATIPSSRFHHASFVNPTDGKYTIFGGYGFRTYSGEFLEFDEESGKWEEIWETGKEQIMPRYFTSAGVDPGKEYVYIFGGMGNECGEAIVGRMYMYDLYRVKLSDGSVEKLWDIKMPDTEIVPGRNIVVTGEHIYAACYPEYNTESEILLRRFSIENGEMETFGTPVPINSDKIGTNANIYLDPSIKKLFLVTKVSPDQKETVLDIYSINFPPISNEDTDGTGALWFVLIILAVILAAAAAFFSKRALAAAKSQKRLSSEYMLSKSNPGSKVFKFSDRPNSINVFGGFKVTDRDGNDITTKFYNQSSLLLVLLIKYRKVGLSARRMSTIFWPDKDEEKSRNSRGFAINALRNKLQYLDGVSVAFREKRYFLDVENPAYCDFLYVENCINESAGDQKSILCELAKGRFLADMEDPSLDNFKSETDNFCLSFLEKEITSHYKEGKLLETLEIADMILQYDPTSEIAITHIVAVLRKIGHEDDAKERFAAFAAEFRNVNGESFRFSYKNLPDPEDITR